jgi:hypothetical protein
MDADQAATVFVEICTRLDELLEAQRRTNELLGGVESALREHLQARTDDSPDLLGAPPQPRGLGHLIPYGGEDPVHPLAATAAAPNQLATTVP